ncbi:type II toxin-antitoxin system VapC family toxin [Novosphingobium sp. KCTC 2891]|uniref:type II toxin-antitoxin system VapC family toxin n=1 Tax=Novosphingobium sp. KCTC 2891 TaxID=2989730 RepID=UPI0022216E61|nr:type II toxin-antitoxin system VapC family toxin [Novosphingobium sp. KCTC 2891]MCW1382701.1 type II toxin-antitoxin system VapC family toxin [Novosphingobium sp. KCTC 2891]
MAAPVFDTCIVADWLAGRIEAAGELSRYPRCRISRVTWTELLAGEPLETRDHVRNLIAPFEVVEVDGRIAEAAADLRYRIGLNLLDALVLATAQVGGSILVTRNTRDFPATMPGVRVPYALQPEGN